MAGKILALVGPSGVGKNYLKSAIYKDFPEIKELTVFTTRPRRKSDGIDRVAGLEKQYLFDMAEKGEMVAVHKPFSDLDYWYGFSKKQITELLSQNKNILTEIHVDNVEFFKKKYSREIFIIGITALTDYLDKNIQSRGSENESDRIARLKMAEKENAEIKKLYSDKFIDRIFEANWENRDNLFEAVIAEVRGFIEKRESNELKKLR